MVAHTPDWTFLLTASDPEAAAAVQLNGSFTSSMQYDALDRISAATSPDASVYLPGYNQAGLLETVSVRLKGAAAATSFVAGIDYDAKGRREQIAYGNGVVTRYTYDPRTFRLLQMESTRKGATERLQALHYHYDPMGNIVEQQDVVQPVVMSNNAAVQPRHRYVYNALYQLKEATGREEAAAPASGPDPFPWTLFNSFPGIGVMHNYRELYTYDGAGNILELRHRDLTGVGSWHRTYHYDELNNRLHAVDRAPGSAAQHFTYNAHGSMLTMPYGALSQLNWNYKDQPGSVDLGGGGAACYHYGSDGRRIRKVIERQGGVREERIYLPGFEVYRKYRNNTLEQELETLHVMDDAVRIAMVETATVSNGQPGGNDTRFRYQLADHLGSVSMEVDQTSQAAIITYEEYHPYGTTSYRAKHGNIEVSEKRYRYTGMERDEETGMSYHTARYYLPWLARWSAADPAGLTGGTLNLYEYVSGNPLASRDTTGMFEEAGHYYTNYFLAYAAGYSEQESFELAAYSQAPDEVASLDATESSIDVAVNLLIGIAFFAGVVALAASGQTEAAVALTAQYAVVMFVALPLNYMHMNETNAGLHSLTGADTESEGRIREEMFGEYDGNTLMQGFILHSIGDVPAHSEMEGTGRQYDTWLGHLRHGHSPDNVGERSSGSHDGEYGEHVQNLFGILRNNSGGPARITNEQLEEFIQAVENAPASENDSARIQIIREKFKEFFGIDMADYAPERQGVGTVSELRGRLERGRTRPGGVLDNPIPQNMTNSDLMRNLGELAARRRRHGPP